MLQQIRTKLGPIRIRQRANRALRWGTSGLMVGAFLGSICLFLSWMGAPISSVAAWTVLIIGILLSVVAGLLWPTSWQSSARIVDATCGLKDRTLSALAFASRPDHEPLHSLQMHDALQHLSNVDASHVVPWKSPRLVPAAIAAIGVMLALAFLLPQSASVANVPVGPLEVILEQAALLEETMLKDFEKLAEEIDDPELEQLAEEMKQSIDKLKEPNVDQREALAQLSEMQATLVAAMKRLDVQRVDAQLQQLAEALQVADATQAASQSLRESKYYKAAVELEKIEASTMSRKQRDAVASNLAKLSNKLGQGKQGQLGDAVQEMIDGLENESDSKCKSGFCKAAGVCRKQGLKKRISECLGCQLNRLSACKGCCQSQGNSERALVAKSDSPSNNAGRGASNRPTGDEKTKLDSTRRDEDLTGIAGDGPSERETLSSAEARQDAARSYSERYAEYRKQMEEVLDSEPLPLGRRETVRKYFESIRPTSAESALVE